MVARNVRDPLLAIEFLSLTFACASRPPVASSDEGKSGTSTSSSTTQPDPEDTDFEEYVTSWGPDGYTYDWPFWSCDPLGQDCPAEEKCVPIPDDEGHLNGAACVPLMGDKAPGEPCTLRDPESGFDDCDETSLCWFVEDGTGVCVPFCGGVADNLMCPDELMCFSTWTDEALWVCVDPCNPLAQDCDAGLACHWSQHGFGCSPTNDTPPPEPCESIVDCAAGSVCLEAAALGDSCITDSCCAAYCDIGDPDGCALQPGTVCTSFWGGDEPPAPELANVGVCLAP
jgi:hypothetical protein